MKKTLIKLSSDSLGDTIACVPYVNKFAEENECDVHFKVETPYHFLFPNSYPKIKFITNIDGLSFDEVITLTTSFSKNLQLGFAEQLGFQDPCYIKPILRINPKERPVKNKYISIGTQSTCQMKYWNHPLGIESQGIQPYWDELCKRLRKFKYTPVCIDRHNSFGSPPFFNNTPKSSVDRTGLSLEDVVNYLQHSEFFIGLSSGLSWLAHALGKKVVMISNFTESYYEFDLNDDDYIRIINKDVCHGCFNKINIDHKFDVWDWYWCPQHKGTDRQFECHKSITPDMVINQIQHLL